MTDRQIIVAFYPEQLPAPPPPPTITYKEAFWKIARGRGLYESQIQAEWLRQNRQPLT